MSLPTSQAKGILGTSRSVAKTVGLLWTSCAGILVRRRRQGSSIVGTLEESNAPLPGRLYSLYATIFHAATKGRIAGTSKIKPASDLVGAVAACDGHPTAHYQVGLQASLPNILIDG